MPKFKDLTGMRFGKLLVLGIDKEKSHDGIIFWICQCDCGNIVSIRGGDLTRKNGTRSCGCIHKQSITKNNELFIFDEYGFGIGFFNGKHSDEFFAFDTADLDCVKKSSWNKTYDGYARGHEKVSCSGGGKKILLHREILSKYEDIDNKSADHINHNKADDRLINLRSATISENNRNRATIKNPSNTGIRNISYKERDDIYEFRTKINSKVYTFSSKDLQKVLDYANKFYADHNLNEFLYKPEQDVRNGEEFIDYNINNKCHPVYTVTKEYMAPPNPEDVITPFEFINNNQNKDQNDNDKGE